MERKKRGRISNGPRFYQQLAQLEDEGFIEQDYFDVQSGDRMMPVVHFRKKTGGKKVPDKESNSVPAPGPLVPIDS